MNDRIAYSLTESGSLDNDHWAIRINNGEFAGVLFQFVTVTIAEPNDSYEKDATIGVQFTYEVLDDENNITEDKHSEFLDTMYKILESIIAEQNTEEENGSTGNNNTEKSSTQRSVHAESLSVSEE